MKQVWRARRGKMAQQKHLVLVPMKQAWKAQQKAPKRGQRARPKLEQIQMERGLQRLEKRQEAWLRLEQKAQALPLLPRTPLPLALVGTLQGQMGLMVWWFLAHLPLRTPPTHPPLQESPRGKMGRRGSQVWTELRFQ